MVSKVFFIASLQLLSTLCVPPSRTKNDLLGDFRKIHSKKEYRVNKEESTASHGQSPVTKTILNREFPSRIIGKPQLYLFDDQEGLSQKLIEMDRSDKNEKFQIRPKVQFLLQEENTKSLMKTNEEILALFPKNSPQNESDIKRIVQYEDGFVEEERLAITLNARHSKLPTADITSLLDDSMEEKEEDEREIDEGYSTNKLADQRQFLFEHKEVTTSSTFTASTNNDDTTVEVESEITDSDDVEETTTSEYSVTSSINRSIDITSETNLNTLSNADINGGLITSSPVRLTKKSDFVNPNDYRKELEEGSGTFNPERRQSFNGGDREPRNNDNTVQVDQNTENYIKEIENQFETTEHALIDNNEVVTTFNDIIEINTIRREDKIPKTSVISEEDKDGNKVNKIRIVKKTSKMVIENNLEANITTSDNSQEQKTTTITNRSKITTESSNANKSGTIEYDMRKLIENEIIKTKEALTKTDKQMVDLIVNNLEVIVKNQTSGIESIEENDAEKPTRNGSWLKAIPFLAYWTVNYIKSDPNQSIVDIVAKAISDRISRAFAADNEDNINREFDPDLDDVTEEHTNSIHMTANTANKSDKLEDDDSQSDTSNQDNLLRKDEKQPNKNFKLSNKPNPCDCQHGGECLPASKKCYCIHGFRGSKCQKQNRKALVVGGLRDFQIRVDSELVGGFEVGLCSPPPYPSHVIAATGETYEDTVVVCGGANIIGGKLTPTNRCHIWKKSNNWSPPLTMSSSRAWAASVLTPTTRHDQMVVMGGVDQNNITLDTIEVIDIKTRKSIKIGLTLPTPLAGHCAVQLNSSHTFIAGGAVTGLAGFGGSANFSNKSWILSETGWTEADQLAQARSVHSCTTVVSRDGDMEVMVVGGLGLSDVGTRMVLDSVEIYNVGTGQWRKGHKLPYPVFGAGLLELAGQPILIGGRYQDEGQLLQSDSSFMYQQSWRSSTIKTRNPRDLAVTVAAPDFC